MPLNDLDLAELARERHDWPQAALGYARALASLPADDDRRRLVAHRGHGAALYRMGRTPEAAADFERARALARRLGDAEAEIDVLLEHATALDWSNDAPAAKARTEEAAAVAQQSGVSTRAVRVGLAVASGRALFREGRWVAAAQQLEMAVGEAEQAGPPAYEQLVIALLLLEVVLPNLGRVEDAALVSERAVALTRARGDKLNLASAINNRRNVRVARGELLAAIDDQREFMAIGREIGMLLAEYFAEYNIAELLYQAGEVEAASAHAVRANRWEVERHDFAERPVAGLLRARMLAFQGLVAEARAQLDQIRAALEEARTAGRPAGALAPSEEVLALMVDLATRNATDEEWDALEARSERDSLEQEPIEVVEMRALAARRQGRASEAEALFARALDKASRIPNVMLPRLRKGVAQA